MHAPSRAWLRATPTRSRSEAPVGRWGGGVVSTCMQAAPTRSRSEGLCGEPKDAIRCNQGCHQVQSGTSSGVITCEPLESAGQVQSGAIRCNQVQSGAIRDAITCEPLEGAGQVQKTMPSSN